MVKISCDASVCKNGFVGLGFIIRDFNSALVGAGMDRVTGNVGVLNEEALAIRLALKYGRELGLDHCIVESDCRDCAGIDKAEGGW